MLSRSSLPDPPSCKTSGGFLPFSLKCSLLMTHQQSYTCTHTHTKNNPACFIETEKKESHIHRCLIISIVYCRGAEVAKPSAYFVSIAIIHLLFVIFSRRLTLVPGSTDFSGVCRENRAILYHSQHVCRCI